MSIELVPLCTLTITLKDPMMLPNTPSGTRTIVEVADAKLEGERLSGTMKGAAAADWATIGPDMTCTLDVRGTFETHVIEPSLAAFEAGVPEPVGAVA